MAKRKAEIVVDVLTPQRCWDLHQRALSLVHFFTYMDGKPGLADLMGQCAMILLPGARRG